MSQQTLRFKEEKPYLIYQEITDLCETWWYDSLFFKKTGMSFRNNKEYYESIQENLICVTGRDEEGILKAVYVGTKGPYMFNKDIQTTNEVVWCISKEVTDIRTLNTLLNEIEALNKVHGSRLFNLNIPSDTFSNKIMKFLNKKGYYVQDISMCKVV